MPCAARFLAVILLAGVATAASAQEVGIRALAAPDAFSIPGRDTDLPATLWQGASLRTARAVLPLLASKPLTPAAAALARRLLATGAPGPAGASDAAGLAGLRASGLLAQGDPKAAAEILAHAPGADRDPDLARAMAESALLTGQDAQACAIAEGLGAGREDVYWLRLRTYCQAIAGQKARAQLTFELAQGQAKDAVFTRLMGAKLAGAAAPGAASLRNGLDFALSRSLGLDLAAAKPSAAVAAAMSGADPGPPSFDLALAQPDLVAVASALAAGDAVRADALASLADAAAAGDAKARARNQAAALMLAALATPLSPESRGLVATLGQAEGKASAARNLALDDAADQKLAGETALLVLWTCAEAGAAGPALGDRVRMIGALHAVGLDADARAFALEGLLALK